MGQTMKKMTYPLMGWKVDASDTSCNQIMATPFVFTRQGSMFFDEEGDLAHEFYEEIQEDASSKSKMCRKYNVLPQGEVELHHPRLHVDFPVVICEAVVR